MSAKTPDDADADWDLLPDEESATAAAPVVTSSAKSTPAAKWIQCESKDSATYRACFTDGWSGWQPYLRSGDEKNRRKNSASLHTQKWLKGHGWSVIPKKFGIYALGLLSPDSSLGSRDVTPADKQHLEDSVFIVNHGIVAGAPAQGNTLNKRLMTYGTKVKTHEWAITEWMKLGFRVFVKWRIVETPEEEKKKLASIDGAYKRKTMETNALSKWKFFLNVSEQKSVKGAGASLDQDPYKLVVREEKGHAVTADTYRPKAVDIKLRCLQLLTAKDKTDAARNRDTIAFLKSL